ncbi:MAG: nuclear transport factor 2 family protein [Xanthomonadales bacterium]|nr:nuclear transport factor 2 family protein [Xanthomonadales bacterium]
MRAWLCALWMLATTAVAAGPTDALVAAERSFAADAQSHGVKSAFLAVLADDSVLFRPRPVNGHDWYAARPDVAPFTLHWAPAAAEVDADLGYTFGPYRLTPLGADGKPGAASGGHFFSVWVLRDGRWQLLLDSGIDHALQELPERAEDRGRDGVRVTGGGEADLGAADDRLNALRTAAFDATAWRGLLASDAIELRSGQPPRAFAALKQSAAMRAAPERALLRVSANGALAATAGASRGDAPQSYQRVWRHQAGGWKLVVDLVGD